ncbi:MAG: hydrogenase iron-sulfur subunit [Candidatus Schekmanbacteria bacterium]|nr:hydrogenase iron-sulfur subunit [Candidatus Schekmanbacteria bacterium]
MISGDSRRTAVAAAVGRAIRAVEAVFDRIYGSPLNPLYQSGVTAVLLLAIMTVTGLYMFLFYSVSQPYSAVLTLDAQWWGGRWIRALHRYSADAALLAVGFHALKMFAGGRSWGPRTLAWVSGMILTGAMLLCGWTGFIMVWDTQAQLMGIELARLLDVLPIFSEPISRTFAGDQPVPSSFFFMNLFLHVALPLGVTFLLWLHTSRMARPIIFPPRRLAIAITALLTLMAMAFPYPQLPEADVFTLPGKVPLDLFYGFWVPFAQRFGPHVHAAFWLIATALLLAVPWILRPRQANRRHPSHVIERICQGCAQCYLDCPYEAIQMVPREVPSEKSALVARVTPELCVSCGICVGSCAPMGVGPPARTGRDELAEARAFAAAHKLDSTTVVLFTCSEGIGADPALGHLDGVMTYPVECAGSLHTSVIELVLRSGAGGVFILTCAARDCAFREGPKWLEQRVFHNREAELKDRVDRRCVRLVMASRGERPAARRQLSDFVREVRGRAGSSLPEDVDLISDCSTAEVDHV